MAARRGLNAVGTRLDRYASGTFILPAVLIILAFSIFPLVASSGADKLLGLDPITFQVANAAQAADNVYPNLFPDK